MRQEMVQQKEGEMELTVLTHMDDMKRASLRTQKYVSSKLNGIDTRYCWESFGQFIYETIENPIACSVEYKFEEFHF